MISKCLYNSCWWNYSYCRSVTEISYIHCTGKVYQIQPLFVFKAIIYLLFSTVCDVYGDNVNCTLSTLLWLTWRYSYLAWKISLIATSLERYLWGMICSNLWHLWDLAIYECSGESLVLSSSANWLHELWSLCGLVQPEEKEWFFLLNQIVFSFHSFSLSNISQHWDKNFCSHVLLTNVNLTIMWFLLCWQVCLAVKFETLLSLQYYLCLLEIVNIEL